MPRFCNAVQFQDAVTNCIEALSKTLSADGDDYSEERVAPGENVTAELHMQGHRSCPVVDGQCGRGSARGPRSGKSTKPANNSKGLAEAAVRRRRAVGSRTAVDSAFAGVARSSDFLGHGDKRPLIEVDVADAASECYAARLVALGERCVQRCRGPDHGALGLRGGVGRWQAAWLVAQGRW